jgi:capsular polysaccharide biosynthesis protein
LTINYSLIDKGSESSEIKELVQDLKNKQYVISIVPAKIIHMNNGIKYYYVEAEYNESKVIINAYGREAEELFKQVHTSSFFGK